MTAREASWNEVLDTVLNSRLRSVHTSLPATIRSYSEANQTATCELAVQLEAAGGEFISVPPLEGVPVTQPGAWANGDKCLLVFCEESFAKWFETGSVEPPDVLQRHGLHAVCIPLVAEAGQAVQFVALANLVDTLLDQLSAAIGVAAQVEGAASGLGGMTALAQALKITVPTPPLPDPPLVAWPANSVAANKVKAR